jgi:hypothetical protein
VTGRVLWAGLELLDRQLVDRNGALCGNIDDLELSDPNADGNVFVEGIVAGPGVLLQRLGARRLGRWLERMMATMDDGRRSVVSASLISDFGSAVTLAIDAEELATAAAERWWREHLIEHIPGSRRADG